MIGYVGGSRHRIEYLGYVVLSLGALELVAQCVAQSKRIDWSRQLFQLHHGGVQDCMLSCGEVRRVQTSTSGCVDCTPVRRHHDRAEHALLGGNCKLRPGDRVPHSAFHLRRVHPTLPGDFARDAPHGGGSMTTVSRSDIQERSCPAKKTSCPSSFRCGSRSTPDLAEVRL